MCRRFIDDYGAGAADEPNSKWNNFVDSIRSKLTVKQVVDGVRAGSSLSFDYLLLIVTADSLAALGLVENNAPNIVAAMLVSPLMGPVMSITFGAIIADRELVARRPRANEMRTKNGPRPGMGPRDQGDQETQRAKGPESQAKEPRPETENRNGGQRARVTKARDQEPRPRPRDQGGQERPETREAREPRMRPKTE
ncbi:hypothetical protein quinque_009774 [Culex quinquefasciatus]